MTPSPAPLRSPDEQRLTRLYQISRELSSRLDINELLPRLLKQTLESTNATTGTLMVVDERQLLRHAALMIEGEFQPNAEGLLGVMLERGLAGWVLKHRESVLIADTETDPRWYQRTREGLPSSRSAVCVPLIGRERAVGVLVAGRREINAFTPEDVSLLNIIAGQAGVALENAQLFFAERRRREISNTLREVARIINATLDVQQVMPLVLEQLARVIPYDTATVLLRAGHQLRVSAARGFTNNAAVLHISFGSEQGVVARVVREKRALVLDDIRLAPDWHASDVPETQAIRAWIGAPLIVKDEVIGVLSVDRFEPGAYTVEDAQIAATFAEQAAIAVVNARLYAASERRSHGLRALTTTAQAINSTLELDEILRLVAGHARQWLGMEAASVSLVDGDRLIFKQVVGPVASSFTGTVLPIGQGIAGWVALHNQPAIVADARADARFYPGLDDLTGFQTRALACVPIQVQDQAIGVIEVVNPVNNEFDSETLYQLDSLASLAGTAIVHARRVAELQAAESRFVGLFEDSLDPILVTNLDGEITDANRRAAEFFGYSRTELVGLRITRVHRMGTAAFGADRFRALWSGKPITYQTRITTKQGVEIPVEVHAKLIERGDEKFVHWIQHDLSERVALEELRNDLMSMIIHDLRSPLGNIISSLDILKNSLPPGDEMLPSLLSIAIRSAARLSRLVDSLLDLRRLESGQVTLNRTAVDMGFLLEDAVELVEPNASGRGIRMTLQKPDHFPTLMFDADMLRRVLVNLLENAVKFTPRNGQISVTAHIQPQDLLFSIKDTGPGIPPADQSRIFNKFTRVQRDTPHKGLGLGLAFCKLAVEAHGGRIWVDSPPGEGANFLFTLPWLPPAAKLA
jgi:PAS domain S-box-containing protein